MFLGKYKRSIDDKWRLPVPNDIFDPEYDGDRDTLYFAPAKDHLIVMTSKYFHQLRDKILDGTVIGNRELRRKLFSNTYAKQRDKNGRIQIPEPLRDGCGLAPKMEVLLEGGGSAMELHPAGKEEPAGTGEAEFDIYSAVEEIGR